ncbi:MAG: hypothetical protein IJU08_02380 [Bacteroidales bacterium]|nr:hypothetical protein [Bacteroidales bacterium]
MKRFFLAVSAALLIVACGKQPSARAGAVGDEASPVAAATTASPVVADAAPAVPSSPAPTGDPRSDYIFVTNFEYDDNDQVEWLKLECRKGEMTQDFGFEFNWSKDKEILVGEGSGEVSEDDINGDGWPDVVVFLGNFGVLSPLYFYGACIWNPDDESFVQVKEYEEIPNAEPCQLDGKPAIKSVAEGLDGEVSTDYYVWEGRKLVLKQ